MFKIRRSIIKVLVGAREVFATVNIQCTSVDQDAQSRLAGTAVASNVLGRAVSPTVVRSVIDPMMRRMMTMTVPVISTKGLYEREHDHEQVIILADGGMTYPLTSFLSQLSPAQNVVFTLLP